MTAGRKTSLLLSPVLAARHDAVKAVTHYSDPLIHEHGVGPLEADITAARRREQGTCPHRSRYPSGLCQRCLAPPAAPGPCDHPSRYPNGRCRTCRELPAGARTVPSVNFSPGT